MLIYTVLLYCLIARFSLFLSLNSSIYALYNFIIRYDKMIQAGAHTLSLSLSLTHTNTLTHKHTHTLTQTHRLHISSGLVTNPLQRCVPDNTQHS